MLISCRMGSRVASWCGGTRGCGILRAEAFGVLSAIFALALLALPARADTTLAEPALRLIMIEAPGCPYCRRWDREVRDAYLASEEGRRAPLQRLMMGSPQAGRFERVTWSPTFILLRGETEVGRIIGYPGADFFWALLGELLAKAGPAEGNTPTR
jgi:hypothetical protein